MAKKATKEKKEIPTRQLALLFERVEPELMLLDRRQVLFRYDAGNARYYYLAVIGPDGEFEYSAGIGITSLSEKRVPKGKGYYKWLASQAQNAEYTAAEKAAWGTALHIECAEVIKADGYNFNQANERIVANVHSNYHGELDKRLRQVRMAVASWMQFLSERVTKVHAIELSVLSVRHKVAATLDYVIDINWERKIQTSIVDIKSAFDSDGEKAYFDAHEYQLAGQRLIFNELYPELPVTALFNWSPVSFKTAVPTFTLKNQSKSPFNKDGYMETEFSQAAKLGFMKNTRPHIDVLGEVVGWSNFNYEDHVRIFTSNIE